ncbi:putative ribonuclease H-like domain-containing protein [Tanacetum coccineum]
MKKMYCLVVTDDYSRFTWVFFLATKDETSGILKSSITGIENLVDHKVKVIRCDNGTEFINKEMNVFCEIKGILRQFSVARTPQQNEVAKRRNKTLIEAARTRLANSKLPTTFGQKQLILLAMCPVTILNTIDHLGKFDGKADEGFFVGYSLNSKAFRVFNSRTRIVEENLHIRLVPSCFGFAARLVVLVTGASQSIQHVDTSSIHIEFRKSPTKSLFDAGSSRISIFTVNTLSITRIFWQNLKDNA